MTYSNFSPIKYTDLKQTILNLISSAEFFVSEKNSCQDSGIYLLFVDNFEDEKIIPFYIGKTTNFQKRFKQYIKDIKNLMYHSYAEYHSIFVQGAITSKRIFDGEYRKCKIFKYIIDHNCTLESLKMIILEKCPESQLNEREQYYLNKFLPAFFGFNQIATITEQFTYRNDPIKRKNIIEKDCQCFYEYMEYGFSTFNYLHAFSGLGNPDLDKKVNLLLFNDLWLSQKELYSNIIDVFENYKNTYSKAYNIITDKYANQLHSIFEKYRFKSKGREADVMSVFTNNLDTIFLEDVSNNIGYLKYYFSRDKRSRACGEEIKELYNIHIEEIEKISNPVKIAFEEYINARNSAIKQSRFSIIFPERTF